MKEKVIIKEYPVKEYYLGNTLKPANRKELKIALLEKVGVCYWCKIKVYDYQQIDGQPHPKDTATIDHIISRAEGREKGEVVEKVLSCGKCNTKRGKVAFKKFLKSI